MADSKEGSVSRSSRFFSDSLTELKKVSSPTKQEIIKATVGALVMIFLVSLYLFGIDQIFGLIMFSFLS